MLIAGLAGCDLSEGSDGEQRLGTDARTPAPALGGSADARVIRGWIAALNRGDYGRAAGYFARGAIVQQVTEARLPDRAAAIAFNRALPCRADVTDIDDEDGTVLAAFRLRVGRRPSTESCRGGEARVRFTIRAGKIREWRQLIEPGAPEGPIASRGANA